MGVSGQLNALLAVAPEQQPPVPTELEVMYSFQIYLDALENE
jgi:hypothetical protein